MAHASDKPSLALRYLTVQDMLWINLQVTKKVNSFDFEKLEEAVFYQFGYGPSMDVIPQAERFAKGFADRSPFPSGNLATAFVGFASFLYLNGQSLEVEDGAAASWFAEIVTGNGNLRNKVRDMAIVYEGVEGAASAVLTGYPATIKDLAIQG